MKIWLLAVCLLALGCEISPVVSAPELPNTRYEDCRRAADDYCTHVVRPRVDEMQHCVAAHAYQCVSAAQAPGGPQT
jgi:hypothetical protein